MDLSSSTIARRSIQTHLDSTPDPPQLLHLSTAAQEEAQMHAHGTDVGAGLTAHPEDAKVAILGNFASDSEKPKVANLPPPGCAR